LKQNIGVINTIFIKFLRKCVNLRKSLAKLNQSETLGRTFWHQYRSWPRVNVRGNSINLAAGGARPFLNINLGNLICGVLYIFWCVCALCVWYLPLPAADYAMRRCVCARVCMSVAAARWWLAVWPPLKERRPPRLRNRSTHSHDI